MEIKIIENIEKPLTRALVKFMLFLVLVFGGAGFFLFLAVTITFYEFTMYTGFCVLIFCLVFIFYGLYNNEKSKS